MLNMKKTVSLSACVVLLMLSAMSVFAAEGGEWKFERNVEIMTHGGLGGGLDLTLRAFASLLEKELGVKVIVDNRSGGNSVTGCTFSYSQPRDGYNFQFIAPSPIAAAAAGQFSVPFWDELVPVSGLVQAEPVIFAYPKNGKFTNLREMVDYAKANPNKLSAAIDTPKGISGAVFQSFCDKAGGLAFRWIDSDSDDSLISVIAGDVDIVVATWTDGGAYSNSGDFLSICTITEDQSTSLPNVASSASIGAPVKLGYYRVFTALRGTPQEAIDALESAIHKVAQSPEWKEFLDKNAMTNDYLWNQVELRAVLDETYKVMGALFKK